MWESRDFQWTDSETPGAGEVQKWLGVPKKGY
jgi:hypothetical protein